jgi:hypothetical protein
MTDQHGSSGPGSPGAPVNWAAGGPPEPASGQPPGPAVADSGKRGGRGAIIIVGILVAFLAVVLFLVRNNVEADSLAVGDCFNIPTATSIQTVEKHACTESHNGEVIFVGEYDGDTYPISLSLNSYVETNCEPAFETYVGRAPDSEPELSIGYFYPSRDGFSSGDRKITCYVAQPDESVMTESVKASPVP